jgi:hypothetical protein
VHPVHPEIQESRADVVGGPGSEQFQLMLQVLTEWSGDQPWWLGTQQEGGGPHELVVCRGRIEEWPVTIIRLDHLVFTVADLDATIRFYTERLGMASPRLPVIERLSRLVTQRSIFMRLAASSSPTHGAPHSGVGRPVSHHRDSGFRGDGRTR